MKPAPDVIMRVSEVLGHVRKPVPVLRVSPIVAALDRPEASLDRETVPRVALSLVKAFAEIPTRVMPVESATGCWRSCCSGRARSRPWTARACAARIPTGTDGGPSSGGYRQPHLVSVLDLAGGAVLGQVAVAEKGNEVAAFTTLLDDLDLTDVLITADGAHTNRNHADYLYTLLRRLRALSWKQIGVARGGHGRVETRQISVVSVHPCPDLGGEFLPHAAQAIKVVRRRRALAARSGPP